MNAELFDPLQGPASGWPDGCEKARAFLAAFANRDSRALIANLKTRVIGLKSGERIFPMSVNDGPYCDCYVALPHSAYALYAKDELRIIDAGVAAPLFRLMADAAGLLLKAAKINRIVHINNWLVSTNLHGDWRGDDIADIRAALTARYPRHLLAVRSLNGWSCAGLMQRLEADGWILLPSRQIYVTDDLVRDWLPRHDTKRDLKLMKRTPYHLDKMETLRPGDAERIAEIYGMLYLERYSRLNPAYTPAFITETFARGIFHYRGLRDGDGRLAAVVGTLDDGAYLTTPILGYDTRRPVREGLYRLASVLLTEMAMEKKLQLHSSAGAAEFKRLRGARAELEYWAFYAGHLSAPRRATIGAIRTILDRVAVPLMRKKGF